MRDWIDEMRQAMRSLRRHPGFALNAIATIALGIASVTCVYALIDSVLLEPVPLPDSERIVAVHRVGRSEAGISLPDVIALRERLSGFQSIATISTDFALDRTDGEAPERVHAALIESQYFDVVGLPPLLGRLLRADDDRSGAAPVVVLGEHYWRSTFAADPKVLGRRLQLSGVDSEIVGVISDRADLSEIGTEVWAPIAPYAPWAPTSPGSNNFEAVARVASGVDVGSARSELATVSTELAQLRNNPDKVLDVTPWLAFMTAAARQGLWLLLAAVGLLLVLATANVAALVLVRTTRRAGELALRNALGASRARMLRLLLAEGLLLGGVGGVLGVSVALIGFDAIRRQAATALPRLAGADIDASVLIVAFAATLISALLFSALPAWRVRSARATARSVGIGQQRAETRTLGALVILELTLATALLGAAGLLAQSFLRLNALPLGFDPGGVVSAEVVLPESRYSQLEPQSRAYAAMVAALAEQPGVEHAAMVVGPPLTAGQGISHTLLVDGMALTDASARYRPFIGDYFAAMGMPTLAGRGIQPGDEAGERLAWVNQAFVARYLTGREPIGARVAWQPGEASDRSDPQWMRVVGVVADVRGNAVRVDDPPVVYAPYLQREANWIRFGTLVARVAGDPLDYRAALAQAVRAGDASVPLGEVASMRDRSDRALASDRFMLQLVALFAALALLLGAQGVYGVVGFAVEQRRGEIGVRLALGASPARAVTTLLARTLPQILIGTLCGLLLTVVAGRLLASVLYGVTASDPVTLVLTASVLVAGALLAAWIPARRVQRVDVAQTLRG